LAVPAGTSAVKVMPTATDAKALSVAVRQDNLALFAVDSGAPSAALAVPAQGGSSKLMVRVTAEDGSHGDYTIALTQSARLSSDASLSALAVSAGTLTPAFSPATSSYSLVLPNGTASLKVTPTAHDASAESITVRQDASASGPVASGAPSPALSVPATGSSSTVTVHVTAQDGTGADYVISVTQQAPAAPASFTIYAAGDSTMADYDPAVFPDQRGWGQQFRNFLTSGVAYVNAAKNGRSSKSFYDEGSWETAIRSHLKSGDFVLIQWAHNDETDNGLDGTDGIGTAPFGTFQTYLNKYVDETKAAGATPILVTPVVRRNFSGAVLTPRGIHDLTGTGDASIPLAQDLNYVEAMKQVATAKGVQLIDLTATTQQLVEQYGPVDSKSIIYIPADDTHLQPLGATLFAQLAVQELISKGIFASFLNPAANLIVSPTALDFGSVFIGNHQDKAISITGLSLAPDSGNVTITAPAGFAVAASVTGTFGASLQLPYTGGKLAPTNVFLRFAPLSASTASANVTVAPQTGDTISVSVTGIGLSLPGGGTESTAVYALTTDDNCVSTGLATCVEEVFSNLHAHDFLIPNPKDTTTPWSPATPAVTTVQRTSIIGDTWPGQEIDIVPDRYVQFAVSPAPGKTWTLDSISLWEGAAGGSNVGFRLQYSTDADFSTATTLLDSPSNVSFAMSFQTFSPAVTLGPGETLYLRAFPWLKGASASGKYMCLQSITFHGTAQ
jgi:lysophospholipase L1-like esterase